MCPKNCCTNATQHAIVFFSILSFLLLPNTFNFNFYASKSSSINKPQLAKGRGARDVLGSSSPSGHCPNINNVAMIDMVTHFLYGVIFAASVALIFIAGGNPSSSSNPKVDYDDPIIRPHHPHPISFPASLGATMDINEDTRGQGGVGHALLRTLPTFAYTKRWRARIGKGIGVCVICQSELRDAQMVRWLPNCDHLFHRVCIDRWLGSQLAKSMILFMIISKIPFLSITPFLLSHSLAKAQLITNEPNSYSSQDPLYTGVTITLLTATFVLLYLAFYYLLNQYFRGPARAWPARMITGSSCLTRGLDPHVLRTFPVFTYSELVAHRPDVEKRPLECAVCLSVFEEDETLRLLPKCDHVFHVECVEKWLATRSTCPYCRAELEPLPGESTRVPEGRVDELGDVNEVGNDVVEATQARREGEGTRESERREASEVEFNGTRGESG
ncbi:hypothetical protein Cgig2_032045 [Carnegiea gigantea]|uniref:RING-type E3 ubiquitin transferase n=1 Tax=Carnegiea gigantea TaxID=171969 RepID=A0A9Q1K5M3_9CARY|nr:hypothetical protein Cgig2_032045 [Carnegiea gigantea]